ncbi:hypothetical protein IG631_20783 [Alternaria alternata]|nr:hypothetical protein IG631_20783 [Alternaria alternata]
MAIHPQSQPATLCKAGKRQASPSRSPATAVWNSKFHTLSRRPRVILRVLEVIDMS